MPEIRALFWDVGGVLLTNAWDHEERNLASERFHLDKDEFEKRHKESVQPFEEGRISLESPFTVSPNALALRRAWRLQRGQQVAATNGSMHSAGVPHEERRLL